MTLITIICRHLKVKPFAYLTLWDIVLIRNVPNLSPIKPTSFLSCFHKNASKNSPPNFVILINIHGYLWIFSKKNS